ncbi:unnamed protein product [Bursaphelenchus xylophilus]|uniref:(pine wood nematode) hypothetical protein n=1 Tax=Bursaphelenchus xylophilus TaxID=6326 RepID=A0A1I7S1N9_BURXY|nr:unnamed protein product [Bursaphelenchus xylophilus]CAG9081199.1 unnamed protein product [Bursaphelenchus xylophilus]
MDYGAGGYEEGYGAPQEYANYGYGAPVLPPRGGMPPRGGPAPRGGGGPRGRGGPPRGGHPGQRPGPGGFGGGGQGFDGFGGGNPGFQPPYEQSPLDAEVEIVTREMHQEIGLLDQGGEYGEQFKNARRLLVTEVERLENNIDPEWLEVDVEKPIRLIRKVLIPTFRHPRFNYVGKVLGPKGTTLQNIAKQFKCHVYVLGRGSTRDRKQEEELLNSGDPAYAHYAGPLHVKIETNAPPSLAYQRVANVLDVLRQLLQPVKETHIPGITTGVPEGDDKDDKNGDDDDDDGDKELKGLKPQPGGGPRGQNRPPRGGPPGGRGGPGRGMGGPRGNGMGGRGGPPRGGGRGGPGGPMRRGGPPRGGGFAPY